MKNVVDSGICVDCTTQDTCTFPKMENKLFCEEHEFAHANISDEI